MEIPAQAHGFYIQQLNVIWWWSRLQATKTCTGSWFLLPLVQCWLNLDVLGSGNSCTGTWFLHPATQRYMTMIASGSDKNLHRHMVFASTSQGWYDCDRLGGPETCTCSWFLRPPGPVCLCPPDSVGICISVWIYSEVIQKIEFRTPFQKASNLMVFPWAIFNFWGPGGQRHFWGEHPSPKHSQSHGLRRTKTCTGSRFLNPLVQWWLNLDVLGSGNSCTGLWF